MVPCHHSGGLYLFCRPSFVAHVRVLVLVLVLVLVPVLVPRSQHSTRTKPQPLSASVPPSLTQPIPIPRQSPSHVRDPSSRSPSPSPKPVLPPSSVEEMVKPVRHSSTLLRSRRAYGRSIPFRLFAYRASSHARSVRRTHGGSRLVRGGGKCRVCGAVERKNA